MALDTEDIKTIESIVKRFKPIAEEVIGLELSNIAVLSSTYSNSTLIFEYIYPNKIIINNEYKMYNHLFNSKIGLSILEYCILHELGHHVAYTINLRLAEKKAKYLLISEGFAEYFAFDLVPKCVLSKGTQDILKLERDRLLNIADVVNVNYILGYDFFSKVTKVFGKEEAFNMIKKPNIMHIEVLFPELYIFRKKIMHKLGKKNGNLQKKQ